MRASANLFAELKLARSEVPSSAPPPLLCYAARIDCTCAADEAARFAPDRFRTDTGNGPTQVNRQRPTEMAAGHGTYGDSDAADDNEFAFCAHSL